MRLSLTLHLLIAGTLLLARGDRASADDFTSEQAFELIRRFCFECHGDIDRPKGDLTLREFRDEDGLRAASATWENVRDALETHDMPPLESPQPTGPERRALIEWIGATLTGGVPGNEPDPGQPVMRRLTRLEYNNTVRDLLELNKDVFMFPERLPFKKDYFRPAEGRMDSRVLVVPYEFGTKLPALLDQGGLPTDTRAEHGFNNRGDMLNLSPMLFEKYMALAAEILDHPRLISESAVCRRLLVVPPLTTLSHLAALAVLWIGLATLGLRLRILRVAIVAGLATTGAQALRMFHRPEWTFDLELAGWAMLAIAAAVFGCGRLKIAAAAGDEAESDEGQSFGPVATGAGWIVCGISLLVIAMGRGLFVGSAVGLVAGLAVATLSERPVRSLAIWFAICLMALGVAATASRPSADYDLTAIRAAAGRARSLFRLRRADFLDDYGSGLAIAALGGLFALVAIAARWNRRPGLLRMAWSVLIFAIIGTTFAIKDVATRMPGLGGPVVVDANQLREVCRRRMTLFIGRAFRRPVDDPVVDRYLELYDRSAAIGGSFVDRMKAVMTGVLCAPEFIFRIEPAAESAESVRALDDHEIASRMSYFLWSTMPDEELARSARQGLLHEDAELNRQVRRMLKDQRIRELSENFAFQWLQMQQIFSARPDPDRFPGYYTAGEADTKETAATCMLIEPMLLFETVLVEDRSVLEFVDADFSYLNQRLAEIYGLASLVTAAESGEDNSTSTEHSGKEPPSNGNFWHRVKLPDRNRGGVVTMAGPLTITSFPFRTSPVKRGAWVLETIFNRPPDEPKMAVSLQSDKDGSDPDLTVRQKFEKHRTDPACAACHGRIDPPGFALENFDPIGGWRTHDGAQPVDAAATFADGRSFDGPAGFKQAVLEHKAEFVRGFVEHLLSFALGRKLGIHDRATVEHIVEAAEKDQFRFSRIIVEIVQSRPFRFISNRSSEGNGT